MAKLKVPSLQHLARNWRENPENIRKILVFLVQNAPTFNYNPLFNAIRDMLIFNVPYDQIAEGIRRGVRREDVRKNLLSVLPLIRDHFDGISPDFVQAVERRFYPIGRGLMVPFEPPLIYGVGGQIYFPWFSFWRQNPLTTERLSLFVTLVSEMLLQDPDLEEAKFEILDFSAPSAKHSRELKVIDAKEISRVSETTKNDMLATFAEGYFMALAELSGRSPDADTKDKPESLRDPKEPPLFE